MRYGILPKLTKDYIMQNLNQEEIFAHYLELDIGTITDCVMTGNLILSPLRPDKTPTFGFKYNGSRLRAKDWNGHFWGDCYDLVGRQLRVNSNSKNGFGIILDQIASDFNLHKYKNKITKKTIKLYDDDFVKNVSKKTVILYTKREWKKVDSDYWNQYYVGSGALKFFDIYPAETVHVNGILRYEYNPKNPAYVYDFGLDENGIREIKVYYPFRKKVRFVTNTTILQGKSKLTCGEVCIVTKSYKDVVSIRTTSLLQAVAPASETHLLAREDYNYLTRHFDFIFSLMDFDRTGKIMAKKLKEEYGIQPLFITQDVHKNKLPHKQKDYTDLLKANGLDYVLNLVNETKEYYSNTREELRLKYKDYDKYY